MTKQLRSPLRYPGGKSRLVKQIEQYAPKNFTEFREPFLGGGSALLYFLSKHSQKNYKVSDNFFLLANFWIQLQSNPELFEMKVCEIKKTYKNDSGKMLFSNIKSILQNYIECPQKFKNMTNLSEEDLAVYFFILNRITFSGLTLSGGFSRAAYNTRFNDSHIINASRVGQALRLHDVKIYHQGYEQLVLEESKEEDVWVFCDPPYDIESSTLYGNRGNQHKGFDHEAFSNCCKQSKNNILITYNDNKNIRKLFSWANINEVDVTYNMNSNNKKKIELFITNY